MQMRSGGEADEYPPDGPPRLVRTRSEPRAPAIPAMTKLLITGAAGLVGSALRPLLRSSFDLVLLDTADFGPLADNEQPYRASITDVASVDAAVRGVDAVLHLAAVHADAIGFEQTLDVNYRGMIVLLDAVARHGVGQVIFASSNHGWGFYQVADTPVGDTMPPRPDGWYGISKLWGEAVLAFYAEAHGFNGTSLRIGNASAEVADRRRLHMWLSFEDLARLVAAVLDRPQPGHRAFFCNSNGPEPFFSDAGLDALGFRPARDPRDHLADPAIATGPALPPDTDIGGSFAAANRVRRRTRPDMP